MSQTWALETFILCYFKFYFILMQLWYLDLLLQEIKKIYAYT